MTALDDWWAVEADLTLSDEERLAQYNLIRQTAFEAVTVPFTVDLLTVVSVAVVGNRVDVEGVGDFSWPLRIYGGPVGVSDPAGDVVKADGSTWYSDPVRVIAQCIRSAP